MKGLEARCARPFAPALAREAKNGEGSPPLSERRAPAGASGEVWGVYARACESRARSLCACERSAPLSFAPAAEKKE